MTWGYNANLGRFTNFVNLLDMAGIAVPSGLLQRALLRFLRTVEFSFRIANHSGLMHHHYTSWVSADSDSRWINQPSRQIFTTTAIHNSEVVDGSDPAAEERRRHLAATGGAPDALPFGVTLLGAAWSDEFIWGLAAEYVAKTGLKNGPAGHGVTAAM